MSFHIVPSSRALFGPFLYRGAARASASSSLLARRYTVKVDHETKYAEKLRQRAAEKGLSIEELKVAAKKKQEEEIKQRRQEREALLASQKDIQPPTEKSSSSGSTSAQANIKTRKDSSPVKPLSSILNTTRLLATPHTAEQISLLWKTYHMSRSEGTGRGYLCASIPLELYQKMASVAEKYPTFIVPLQRPKAITESSIEGVSDTAYEFFLLQWDFHDAPPVPTANEDPFANPSSESQNPRISTILFTPLEEYKLRNSFATPYMALTNYTDLATTHGTVLLRGEITPRSGASGNFMLSQADAQQLSIAIQKFYLWGDKQGGEEKLLRTFHENPQEFKWEDLLKMAEWSI